MTEEKIGKGDWKGSTGSILLTLETANSQWRSGARDHVYWSRDRTVQYLQLYVGIPR